MYRFVWDRMPFGRFGRFGRLGKIVSLSVLLAGVVALLWFVVFPAADALLPFNNVQVTAPDASPTAHAAVMTATTRSDTCAC